MPTPTPRCSVFCPESREGSRKPTPTQVNCKSAHPGPRPQSRWTSIGYITSASEARWAGGNALRSERRLPRFFKFPHASSPHIAGAYRRAFSQEIYQLGSAVTRNGRSRPTCPQESGGAAPGDVAEFWLRPAQGCDAFARFARNESLKTRPDKRGRFFDAGDLPCFIQQGVINDDSDSHVEKSPALLKRFFLRGHVLHEIDVDFITEAGLVAYGYCPGRRDFDHGRNDVALPVSVAR
jgi:hypothetical protein